MFNKIKKTINLVDLVSMGEKRSIFNTIKNFVSLYRISDDFEFFKF